ncbi:class I SAM-dependent methyltransferase [Lysinibacillus sp. K60]|uniref:class I SAM-dependent methyltransferase n=1 Tax=Lysinibacillus sp. K60 TaxID=2720027 RepID=UPI001C8C8764|nr:class I SAM-dependent methyltransferase [Lysinibacillus sp. K60]MBX8943733.1 class I SAM-dependent methyltransferase [Lysinibacillus sp. K60]
MNQQESSITSLVAAFSRAYHSQFDTPKIFDDYIAKELISQEEYQNIQATMIQGIEFFNKDIATKFKDNSKELIKWVTQVQLSPTPLARAAYCERVLHSEIQLGVEQYVILGAVFDTFPYRQQQGQSRLEIFEVDYPTTQASKMRRLQEASLPLMNHLHFVPMDFTKQFQSQLFSEQGFQSKKTFFSLLGVSYYLTKDELASLLNHLFALVPAGSSIVLDYADESLFTEKGLSKRVENMVKMAALGGEPMKSCYAYEDMERMLDRLGLLIYEHLSPTAIQELYFQNRTDYLCAFETIHYMHIVKK